MSVKFQIRQIGALALAPIDCPDPNWGPWEWMSEAQVSISNRLVQQGGLRCTLRWEIMSDAAFDALMQAWKASRINGYRIHSATLPPMYGLNATWPEVFGFTSAGGYIRIRMPQGRRTILHAEEVTMVFENIAEPE